MATELRRHRAARPSTSELAAKLKSQLPFPTDYNRSDPSDYEAYRRKAISILIHYGLSATCAHRLVDDCIAIIER